MNSITLINVYESQEELKKHYHEFITYKDFGRVTSMHFAVNPTSTFDKAREGLKKPQDQESNVVFQWIKNGEVKYTDEYLLKK